MKSLWSDAEAAQFTAQSPGPLGPRVYTSRLLGRDKSLVLHGGGNTSVKLRERDAFGAELDVLYVKGSGSDLETIEASGFSPLPLEYLRKLAGVQKLSDAQMRNELDTHVLRADAPFPSVETLLHALVPHPYVDHTHADAVLSIGNAPDGANRIRDLYGDRVVVIPYVMAGFELAAHCAREFPKQAGRKTIGMVLLSHGIFSFGADARESYERMIELVSMAEEYLKKNKAWSFDFPVKAKSAASRQEIAELRRAISEQAGAPMTLRVNDSQKLVSFAQRTDVDKLSQSGPATPDHLLFTKPVPMIGRDAAGYASRYRAYFERHARRAKAPKTMLDPAPRVVLDPVLGLAAAGRNARESAIVEELYDHTIDVILRAQALGGWRAVGEEHLFDIEYWDLEQAKLHKSGAPLPLAGETVLVTGAASGIGKACVEAFLKRGAAVVGIDRNQAIEKLWTRPDVLGITCDLTNGKALDGAIDAAVRRFGGVDMLVLNAGMFPSSQPIQEIAEATWRQTMSVNLDAPLRLLQMCHPLLKLAPRGGRIVVIGSRNVPAPGPGAAAYSASKAALNQVARVAALEWAKDGIRINSLHPDAVYDTGLWTQELLAARAKAYNLTVEQYKKKNLLKTEVSSRDVAELAAEMCGPLFARTTAAQVPVDGGNERVV
jgi:rhamnose utilization protein RhaD (predicted bifunctional aldolase and dehydrogenase)/NAD(P)-dependent dehydrogenase (short-subunit alcohol dehydrogenase family)